MMTYSTCSGATPAFSRAPLMATPPRSDPEKSLSEPSSRPMGVRAPATITEVGRSAVMGEASSDVIGDVAVNSSRDPARPLDEHDQAHTAYSSRMPSRRPTLGP